MRFHRWLQKPVVVPRSLVILGVLLAADVVAHWIAS
jgi:hypothetical protein